MRTIPPRILPRSSRDALPIEQREEVTASKALEEEMFLGLRELYGVDLARIERQYGVAAGTSEFPTCARRDCCSVTARAWIGPGKLALANEVFVAFLD